MSVPILNKRIEMALRIAISKGGTLSYNPDMYRLGFADNIPPSEEFNNELKKYGNISYGYSMDDDFYNSPIDSWSSFTINNKGKDVIRQIDKERNGYLGLNKIFRFLCSTLISLIGYAIGFAIICVAANYLSHIDANEEYSWYMGIWHAVFIIPNLLLHFCYDSNILFFAKEHTSAYALFFWVIFVIFGIPAIFQLVKSIIVEILKQWVKS